jgi:hypothetical protein
MPTPKKPARVVDERVYEADIIRNAKRPNAPPVVLSPPPLGTTSRAYANARGSQSGLNIPNSTNATTPGSGLAGAAAVRLSGGGSGGGGGGAVAPVDPLAGYVADKADLSKNPIPALYDTLLAYTKANADARPAIYQQYSDKFKVNQEAANKQLYDAYLGSRTEQDAQATAFGVDPAIVAQARDLAMRKSQENSDQSLADNQAWLLKSGLLSQQQAMAMGDQYAKERVTQSSAWDQLEEERVSQLNLLRLQLLADQISAKSKGGGGGGGRRGGGGSSSSGDTGVTETMTSDNPEMDLALMELKRTNPALAAIAERTLNLSGRGDTVKAAQEEYDRQVQIANTRAKPLGGRNPTGLIGKALGAAKTNIASTRAKIQLPTLYAPNIQFAKTFSGTGSNPKKKVTQTTKGRAG